jgi:hypothetical protein
LATSDKIARVADLIARLHRCQVDADQLDERRCAIAIGNAIIALGGDPALPDADMLLDDLA